MDRYSIYESRINDDSFAQYCLQTLAPLIILPLNSEDREIIKSQSPPCTCSKSGCLKLYCECFSKGRYCIGCNCINCFNIPRHESVRSQAMALVNKKKGAPGIEKMTKKGCICKKSKCEQRYCKCRLNGNFCSQYCTCADCKNLDPSLIN